MRDNITVLVIEDEPSVADALEIILGDAGYEVVVALNGRDGLLQAGARRFDVIISDFRLPDMTGLDVLAKIREKVPDNKVIIITAHGTPELISESKCLGAIDVLPKPFFPSDILNLISFALTKKKNLSFKPD